MRIENNIFFVVLEIEPRALCMLELHFQSCFYSKLVSNSKSSCYHFQVTGITGMNFHAWLKDFLNQELATYVPWTKISSAAYFHRPTN
jgi:hypothetical protein